VQKDKYGRKLAGTVEVHRTPRGEMGIRIDGDVFPWYTLTGYTAEVRKGQMPCITVTIPAEHVMVDDQYMLPADETAKPLPGKETE